MRKKSKSLWKAKMMTFIILFKKFDNSDFCHDKYLKIKVNSDDNLSLKNFRYEWCDYTC